MPSCPYHIKRTERQKTNNKRRIVLEGVTQAVYNENIADWDAAVAHQKLNFTSSPYAIGFSQDGTYFIYHNSLSNLIGRQTCSTPWDVSTAGTQDHSTGEPPAFSVSYGICFSDDGTKLIIFGATSVHEVDLSTPYDLTSAGTWVNTIATGTWQGGGCVSEDGLHAFGANVGAGVQKITQYSMSPAWDTTSMTSTGNQLDISDKISTAGKPVSIWLGSLGTEIYAATNNGEVHQWTMATAHDITTATYTGTKTFTLTATIYRGYMDTENGRYIYMHNLSGNDVFAYESNALN